MTSLSHHLLSTRSWTGGMIFTRLTSDFSVKATRQYAKTIFVCLLFVCLLSSTNECYMVIFCLKTFVQHSIRTDFLAERAMLRGELHQTIVAVSACLPMAILSKTRLCSGLTLGGGDCSKVRRDFTAAHHGQQLGLVREAHLSQLLSTAIHSNRNISASCLAVLSICKPFQGGISLYLSATTCCHACPSTGLST